MTQLSEIARFVDDVQAATAWYAAILKCEPTLRVDGMSEFQLDGVTLRLHKMYEPGPNELPPENHIALTVENLDARCAQLREVGFDIEVPPQEFPWGRSVYLRDPDGDLAELHEGH